MGKAAKIIGGLAVVFGLGFAGWEIYKAAKTSAAGGGEEPPPPPVVPPVNPPRLGRNPFKAGDTVYYAKNLKGAIDSDFDVVNTVTKIDGDMVFFNNSFSSGNNLYYWYLSKTKRSAGGTAPSDPYWPGGGIK